MKKELAFGLAAVMVFALAACGGSSAPAATAAPAAAPAADAAPAAAPEKAPKKKGKAGLIIGIVLAALIAAAAVIYFTGLWTKLLPASRLKLGLAEKTFVDLQLDKAFDPVIERVNLDEVKANAEVTCELETSGGIFSETTYIKMLVDELKLNVDLDLSEAAKNFKLALGYKGNPMLDATLLYNSEQVGVYIPQLDSNYYTMKPEKLMELASGDEGGSAPDLDLDLTPFDEAKTRKEVMDLLKILSKLSTKANTTITKDFEASLFDSRTYTKVDKYSIKPTAEQYEAVINEIADYLGSGKSYLGERLNGFYKAISGISATYVIDDSEVEGASAPKAENISEYIKNTAKDTAKELADSNTVIEILLVGNDVVSHRVITDDGEAGVDSETNGKVEHVFAFYNDEDGRTTADVVADKTNASNVTVDFEVISDDAEAMTISGNCTLDTTKRSAIGTHPCTFTLKLDGNDFVNISVAESGSGMQHTVKVKLPEDIADDITAVTLNALVNEGGKVEVPSGVTPTDLSDKSADEIGEIFGNMIDQLSSVFTGAILGGLF